MPKAFLTHLVVSALILMLSGCAHVAPTRLVYRQPEPINKKEWKYDDGDYFLAVTVSTGGSRSAVWNAAVLKELFKNGWFDGNEKNIIDEIDYISCVSAGSLSSAYYCLEKPARENRDKEDYYEFFEEFIDEMSRNIEKSAFFRPRLWLRVLSSPMEKAFFLKDDFNLYYLSGLTFEYLQKRTERGDAPVLIVNGTVLNSGERFLFTTLNRSNFAIDTKEDLKKLRPTPIALSNISLEDKIYSTLYAEDLCISIRDMKLSWAIASSISVPPIIGPVPLMKREKPFGVTETYFHISDGGVCDPLGLETVLQLFNHRVNVEKKEYRGAMIIVIDARRKIDEEDTIYDKDIKVSELTSRTNLIYSGQATYLTYITYMFSMNNEKFKNLKLVHITPYDADDKEFVKEFEKIPTRLRIERKQVKVLKEAAEEVVKKVKDEIIENFEGE